MTNLDTAAVDGRTADDQTSWESGKAAALTEMARSPERPILLADEGDILRSDGDEARRSTYFAIGWNHVWASDENTLRSQARKVS